jgi:hypothetical protein
MKPTLRSVNLKVQNGKKARLYRLSPKRARLELSQQPGRRRHLVCLASADFVAEISLRSKRAAALLHDILNEPGPRLDLQVGPHIAQIKITIPEGSWLDRHAGDTTLGTIDPKELRRSKLISLAAPRTIANKITIGYLETSRRALHEFTVKGNKLHFMVSGKPKLIIRVFTKSPEAAHSLLNDIKVGHVSRIAQSHLISSIIIEPQIEDSAMLAIIGYAKLPAAEKAKISQNNFLPSPEADGLWTKVAAR